MTVKACFLSLSAVLLLIGTSQAAETQPAAVKPSWATPTDAYLAFYRAMTSYDGKLMQQSVAWEKPADGELVGQMYNSDVLTQTETLGTLLTAQFPNDADIKAYVAQNQVALDAMKNGNLQVAQAAEASVKGAETKIEGDSATLTLDKDFGSKVVKFKKLGDKWLMLPESVGAPYAPADDAMRQEMAKDGAMMKRTSDLKREGYAVFIKDLQAKKFATGKDALAAIQTVEREAMMKMMSEMRPDDLK